jgi:uncharacterized protein YndB with AHSA1/START domain
VTEEKALLIMVKHKFSLPPERIFDAFLDLKIASLFLFATPTGEMIVVEMEPRVGGSFTFTERRPDMGDVRHIGEYLEIDRPRRLVFTFGVPQFDPRMTIVMIDILAEMTGCELTLSHEGVLPDYAERTTAGWTRILAGLEPAYENVHAAGWR